MSKKKAKETFVLMSHYSNENVCCFDEFDVQRVSGDKDALIKLADSLLAEDIRNSARDTENDIPLTMEDAGLFNTDNDIVYLTGTCEQDNFNCYHDAYMVLAIQEKEED